MAEWLRGGLQNLIHGFDSRPCLQGPVAERLRGDLQSRVNAGLNPARTSSFPAKNNVIMSRLRTEHSSPPDDGVIAGGQEWKMLTERGIRGRMSQVPPMKRTCGNGHERIPDAAE